MLFELCNTPATFERLMETVLHGLSSEACLVYLDDIIIVGRTFEEHLNNPRKVFQRLQKANLKLSPKKCSWTDECEKSFNSLKQALTSSPILTYPRIDKDFILDTDASNEGIGAVLSQNIGNEERVIAYFSKSLEHFHHYLYGQKFLLQTDHAFLRWLLNFKEPEGQIACWIQRLQKYDFEIQHRKGTSHGNADALPRRPCKESCKHCANAEKKFGIETDTTVKVLTTSVDPWSSYEIQKAQLEDPA
ncbi:Retrovirus-related Pol polyprotein from transposon 297 [Araneus ventricosus]|uniref:Retrovirus-related Pol polyprotein from transposon 297 n=1 Tax=Araneus ventricosus TaxID=182803 RepID=A0A4Y2A7A5_ARAVE|nr:Retrovirus-related Pol polyprotein from transposon 297 [Araneus ventricosus]